MSSQKFALAKHCTFAGRDGIRTQNPLIHKTN